MWTALLTQSSDTLTRRQNVLKSSWSASVCSDGQRGSQSRSDKKACSFCAGNCTVVKLRRSKGFFHQKNSIAAAGQTNAKVDTSSCEMGRPLPSRPKEWATKVMT